jgi:hypothetical protein
MNPFTRFCLPAFEGSEVGPGTPADALRQALEDLVLERLTGPGGVADVEALVRELNGLGHAFEPRPSSPGWASWFQTTNGGARDFFIHAEPGELATVMVLYHETLETTVERRRAGMSPKDRARAKRVDRFYERALALAGSDLAALPEADRLLVCLHTLETGVNNGGFRTYLGNTDGAELAPALAFLERIGAEQLAGIVARVLELLPSLEGGLRDETWTVLDPLEEALAELDGRFLQVEESIPLLALDYLEGLQQHG